MEESENSNASSLLATGAHTGNGKANLAKSKPLKIDTSVFGNPTIDFIGATVPNASKIAVNNTHRRVLMQKNMFWKSKVNFVWLAPLFSVLTFCFLLAILSNESIPRKKYPKVIFLFVILTILPFFNPTKHSWSSMYLAGTATLLLICVVVLESIIGRQQCMVTYLAMVVGFRIIHFKTIFDNFALCLAYSADIIALHSSSQSWFFTSKIVLWSGFCLSVLIYQVLRRMSFRIWEHVRILIVYKEKCMQEALLANATIRAHFSPDLVEHIFSPAGKQFLKNVGNKVPPEEESSNIIKAALQRGVIPRFIESNIRLDQIRSLDGMNRSFSTIIAIKQDVGQDRECDLTSISSYVMHDFFDLVAKDHKVTSVRRFGDVWIGCVGFVTSHGQQGLDCLESVVFASEIMQIAEALEWKLCCAIDCGTIIGGFVGSMHFDIYGPEIRWVLSMVEARKTGTILVSPTLRQKMMSHSKEGEDESKVQFDRNFVQPMWRPNGLEKVYSVANMNALTTLDDAKVAAYMTKINSKEYKSMTINWQKVQRTLDNKNINKISTNESTSSLGSNGQTKEYRQSSKMSNENDIILSISSIFTDVIGAMYDEWCVDSELGPEFQSDVSERHNIMLNDPILDDFLEQRLIDEHADMEKEIISLIKTECFNSVYRKWFLISSVNFNDGVDRDEHEAMVSPLPEDDSMPPLLELIPLCCRSRLMSFITTIQEHFTISAPFNRYVKRDAVVPVESEAEDPLYVAKVSTKPSNSAVESQNNSHRKSSRRFQKLESIKEENSGSHMISNQNFKEEVPTTSTLNRNTVVPIGVPTTKPFLRSWSKYSSDAKLYFHNTLVTVLAYTVVAFITWYVLYPNYPDRNLHRIIDPFLICYYIQLLVPTLFNRKYDTIIFWFMTVVHVVYVLSIPRSIFCTSIVYGVDNVFANGSSIYNSYGDWGGECRFILLIFFDMQTSLRLPLVYTSFNNLAIIIALYFQSLPACGISRTSWLIVLLISLLRLSFYWIVEFRTYVSYIIEHKLVAEAKKNYYKQFINCRNIFKECSPLSKHSTDLYSPRRYRNCAIVAVHIKAADILPGILDPKNVGLFFKQIFRVIDNCIVECDMLKVTQFSGVMVAAACKDLSWDSAESVRASISHISRAVMLMRDIQQKIDLFNRQGNFHVSLGIGLNHGSISMGFLGNARYSFDMAGTTRDMACAMASFQSDGNIYASESFSTEINSRGRFHEDFHAESFMVMSGNQETTWYKIDGTFSGIDLSNFEYICMLGRGGYGSVHLLREKTTNDPYAIKAIPRRYAAARMIQREFQILQQMYHPNVVKFEYCIIYKTRIFLVMEYIKGGNLREIVERDKPELAQLRFWYAELVLALEYVHSRGIIHRDVKPANCMIGTNGHLKLADFGLSKSLFETKGQMLEDGMSMSDELLSSRALSAIKTLLPLNVGTDTGLKEKSIEILLIDADETSKNKIFLSAMYYSVTQKGDLVQAEALLTTSLMKFDLLVLNVDSFESLSITESYKKLFAKEECKDPNYFEDLNNVKICNIIHFFCEKFYLIPLIVLSEDDISAAASSWLNAGARHVYKKSMLESVRNDIGKVVKAFRQQKLEELEANEYARSISISSSTSKMSTMTTDDKRSTFSQNKTEQQSEDRSGNSGARMEKSQHHSIPDEAHSNKANSENENELSNAAGVPNASKKSKSVAQIHSAVGTLHFMAPEVITEKVYGKAVDWWACGITFYECVTREHLFKGLDKEEVFERIVHGPIDLSILSPLSPSFENLLRGLLNRNYKERLGTSGAQTIRQHEFFKGIDWATISQWQEMPYKPPQYNSTANTRMDKNDKVLFYGDIDDKNSLDSKMSQGKSRVSGGNSSDSRSVVKKKRSHRQRSRNHEHFDRMSLLRKRWISGGGSQGNENHSRSSSRRSGFHTSGSFNSSMNWSLNSTIGRVPEEEESSGDTAESKGA